MLQILVFMIIMVLFLIMFVSFMLIIFFHKKQSPRAKLIQDIDNVVEVASSSHFYCNFHTIL